MAKSMIEYLRSNPEAAKATYDEAQRLLQVTSVSPGKVTSLALQGCKASCVAACGTCS